MGLRSMARPLARLVRATPGYPSVRRRVIAGLRGSTTARRVSRSTFPDLLDPRQVDAAVTAAVQVEREQRNLALHEQRVKHSTRLKELRAEHRETLRRTRADFARKEDRRRRALPPVSAGTLVAGLYLADRPLILCDVRGVDGETAEAVLEEIAREQVLGCAFRPMFLADADTASVWRGYGHLCEVVPPADGWQGEVPYEDYLAARLESIRADLGARWCLHVPPDGLTQTQRAFLRRVGR